MINVFGFICIAVVLFFMTEMYMRGIKQMRAQQKAEKPDA